MNALREDTTGLADYFYEDFPELFKQAPYISTTHGRPGSELASEEPSFSDEMPWNFGFFFHNDENVVGRRKKLQHTLGVVGSVRLESTGNHDYTGLFTGADYGVVRLSDGGFIHDGMTKFNPSGAMKFFVDG